MVGVWFGCRLTRAQGVSFGVYPRFSFVCWVPLDAGPSVFWWCRREAAKLVQARGRRVGAGARPQWCTIWARPEPAGAYPTNASNVARGGRELAHEERAGVGALQRERDERDEGDSPRRADVRHDRVDQREVEAHHILVELAPHGVGQLHALRRQRHHFEHAVVIFDVDAAAEIIVLELVALLQLQLESLEP